MSLFTSVRRLLVIGIVITYVGVLGVTIQAQTTLTIGTWLAVERYEELYGRQMAVFEEANPDIKLEIITVAGHKEYAAKLILLAATGDIPDVLMLPPEQVGPVVNAGMVADLSQLYDRDIHDLDAWFSVARESVQFNGIIFGVPAFFVNYTYAYNTRIMDEKGMAHPAADEWVTWDYISDTAKKLTNTRGDGVVDVWGYNQTGTNYVGMIPLIYQAGGTIFDENQLLDIDNEPTYLAAEWLRSLIQDGVLGGSSGDFWSGNLATMRLGTASLNEEVIAMADEIETTSGIQFRQKDDVVYTTSYAMSAGTKIRDEAWRFLQFIPSRESQAFVIERGRVPVRGDVDFHTYTDAIRILSGFFGSITEASPFPYHVHSDNIQSVFSQMIRQIWEGVAPTEAVIPQIQQTINATLPR